MPFPSSFLFPLETILSLFRRPAACVVWWEPLRKLRMDDERTVSMDERADDDSTGARLSPSLSLPRIHIQRSVRFVIGFSFDAKIQFEWSHEREHCCSIIAPFLFIKFKMFVLSCCIRVHFVASARPTEIFLCKQIAARLGLCIVNDFRTMFLRLEALLLPR